MTIFRFKAFAIFAFSLAWLLATQHCLVEELLVSVSLPAQHNQDCGDHGHGSPCDAVQIAAIKTNQNDLFALKTLIIPVIKNLRTISVCKIEIETKAPVQGFLTRQTKHRLYSLTLASNAPPFSA